MKVSAFSLQKNHEIVNHEICCCKCDMKLGLDQKGLIKTFYSFSVNLWFERLRHTLSKVSFIKLILRSGNFTMQQTSNYWYVCVHTHFKSPCFSFSNRKVTHTYLIVFPHIKKGYVRSLIPNTFLAVRYNKNKQTHKQNRDKEEFLHLSPFWPYWAIQLLAYQFFLANKEHAKKPIKIYIS